MKNNSYDEQFYEQQKTNSLNSAKVILAHLFDQFRPSSVVDFGCGVGTWLAAAKELNGNSGSYLGLDGEWGGKEKIIPPGIEFLPKDLSGPIQLGRRFDLAISLEVAEHLPEQSAPGFIESIARSSDIVLFGAAIPNQGGVNHINEQYQSYWCQIFAELGFICLDAIRPYFFDDHRVGVAYRQNAFLYVKEDSNNDALFRVYPKVNPKMLNAVHPIVFERHSKRFFDTKFLLKRLIKNAVGK